METKIIKSRFDLFQSPIDIIMNKVGYINEPLLNAVTSPDTLCLEEIIKLLKKIFNNLMI